MHERAYIQSVDIDVWVVVVNGRFEPQVNVDGVIQNKPKADWIVVDEKKVQYDLKARNILISALGINVYYLVSHCKTGKAMWEAFATLHEGTKDVKQSKIDTITQQFELFHVKEDENISSMQLRFIHIVNNLQNLGKTISNQDCTNKILRCMNRK